jgi:hypothetical protein
MTNLYDPYGLYVSAQTVLVERRREADQQRLLNQLPRTRIGLRAVLAQVVLRLARSIDDRAINPAAETTTSWTTGAASALALRQ